MVDVLAHLFTPQHSNNHRPKLLHPEGFFVLATFVLVFHVLLKTTPSFTPLGQVLGYSSSITANQVMNEINEERTQAGLSQLRFNQQLSNAAVAKATDMFNEQYWAHNSPSGLSPWSFIKNAGYSYTAAGENLARDFGDTTSMVSAWMASPSHKENVLNSKYVETGIAVVDGQLNGVETTLVVQLFGAPSPSTSAKTETVTKSAASTKATGTANTALRETVPQPSTGPRTLGEQVQQQQQQQQASTVQSTPIFSPLQLSKALSLAMLLLLIGILLYDMVIASKNNTVRVVGRNIAHIALFLTILIATIVFRSGVL